MVYGSGLAACAVPRRRWRGSLRERLRGAQGVDLGGGVAADLAQDGVGVGAEAWGGAAHAAVARRHAPGDADVLTGPYLRMGQLDEEAARAEVGVLGDVAVGGGGEGGDPGGLERRGRLLRRLRAAAVA